MGSQQQPDPGRPELSDSDRLDTWKEVAAHLRRSVRTVQRWEREEGLPVHRHLHEKLGSIYAFRSEIDQWWGTRGSALQESGSHRITLKESADEGPRTTISERLGPVHPRALAIAAGMVAAVLVGVGLPRVLIRPAASPHQPHRFLIASFENLTGEPSVAERVRDTVQEQLSARRLAHVVPADQVAEYLRLMGKPETTPISAAVGREISRRDGAIEGYVTGVLEGGGDGYTVTLRFVTPENDTVLATVTVHGSQLGQLLESVREQIAQLQGKVDEQLAHGQRRAEMPKVTTTSLQALELYARAAEVMDQVPFRPEAAFGLLTDAVRIDAEFASAYILAAWALKNAGRGKDEFLPYAERAFALADRATEPERYFILGSYYQLKGDFEKSVPAYESLLRLNPRHYWTLGNLGRLYRARGQNAAAAELRARQVEIRPGHFWGQFRMAESLLLQGDLEGAKRHAAKAASLVSHLDSGEMYSRRSWLDVLGACEAWLRDDVSASARMAGELQTSLPRRVGMDRNALTTALGYWYLALGQRQVAEQMFSRLPESVGRSYHLGVVAAQYGDSRSALKYLEQTAASTDPSPFFLGVPFLDPAALPIAERLLARRPQKIDDADRALLRGQMALMKGDLENARVLLEESIEIREDRFGAPALAASSGIAVSWRKAGDVQQAIRVLEDASQNRYRSCLWPTASAHLWIRMRRDLADLYRLVGRETEARAIDGQLNTILKVADAAPLSS
jgi:tetratricopeptide (TPR) repeat protein